MASLVGAQWRSPTVDSAERGNAPAEFVMVSTLVILFFALVVQISFALYTKNMLVDAAVSGARYGTLLHSSETDARSRAQELIATSLPVGYAAEITSAVSTADGVDTLEIDIKGPLPLLGTIGFPQTLSAKGRSVIQE